MKISDLLDVIEDDTVPIREKDIIASERIKEVTMSKINADMARNRTAKQKSRQIYRTILIAAVIAALFVGTALAVAVSSGFLQSVFGPKGWEDSPGMTVGDDVLPAKEWAEVDEQTAQAIVGDYVQNSGVSIQAGDYVFNVDDYLLDENGFGAISYTLRRSDGGTIPGYQLINDGYSGQYTLDFEWLLSPPMLTAASGAMLDRYDILDKDLTTDTELHGILYIESLRDIPENDIIYVFMNLREKQQLEVSGEMMEGSVVVGQTERIELPTDTRLPALAFTNGEYTIWLSSISMVLDAPSNRVGEDFGITVHYADGSEYVVTSSDPYTANIISGGYLSSRHSLYYMFNRLVDAESVVSVTIDGTGATAGAYTPDVGAERPQKDVEAESAYQEYLIQWVRSAIVNSNVTDEQPTEEFIPAIQQSEYELVYAMLDGYGLSKDGFPLTYEQFTAADGLN